MPAAGSGEDRRRGRQQANREATLGDWYEDDLAGREIEARQPPSLALSRPLARIMAGLNSTEAALLRRIIEQWPALVGGEVMLHARPRTLCQGVLLVEVENASWRLRLTNFGLSELTAHVKECTAGAVKAVKLVPAGRTPPPSRPTRVQ